MIGLPFFHVKIFIIIVFLTCYFLLMLKKGHPLLVMGSGIAILLVTSCITFEGAIESINYNVLGIFWGTMVLSQLFVFSGVPRFLAKRLIDKVKTTGGALLAVCLLSGFISSFVENVATLLIVAPIALEAAKKLKVSPIPFLIGVAVSSNLQGCATMIGDSPSIILAMAAKMSFNDFFWMLGRPGIFFAVELGAVGGFYILYLIYKKYTAPVERLKEAEVKSWFPAILMALMILTLAISSFIKDRPYYTMACICIFYGGVGLIWHQVRQRESLWLIRDLDWRTFFFLIGIFILVGSLTQAGIIEDIADRIALVVGENRFVAYLVIVWLSVLLSAFVDNIPYTVAMIPVAKIVATNLGMPIYPMLFGLLVGTCVGGNISPIGASTNVVAVGLLKKEGYPVSFKEFAKVGLPFTLVAVTLSSLLIWVVWVR